MEGKQSVDALVCRGQPSDKHMSGGKSSADLGGVMKVRRRWWWNVMLD